MGSARASQETKEVAEAVAQSQNIARKRRELESKLKFLEAQITALNSEFETEKEELNMLNSEDAQRIEVLAKDRSEMGRRRGADASK